MYNHARRLAAGVVVCSSIMLGGTARPGAAQPVKALSSRTEASSPAPALQDPMATAVGINMRRSKLYQDGDIAGAAALYTEDAAYIELMPILQVLKGRDQIVGHFDELASAYIVSIVPTVLRADRRADGTIPVSGDYLVFVKDDANIAGHFVQTLRQEDKNWRIAKHLFARPDPITATDLDKSRRD